MSSDDSCTVSDVPAVQDVFAARRLLERWGIDPTTAPYSRLRSLVAMGERAEKAKRVPEVETPEDVGEGWDYGYDEGHADGRNEMLDHIRGDT